MSVTEYLFAVQDGTGREVVSTRIELEKVSEVTAVKVDDSVVRLLRGGEEIAAGETASPARELALYRWPADDKLSTPVRKPVATG